MIMRTMPKARNVNDSLEYDSCKSEYNKKLTITVKINETIMAIAKLFALFV